MKTVHLLSALTAGLVLASCGNGDNGKTSNTNEKKITMSGWYDEVNMQPVLDVVNEKLEGKYELDYTILDFGQYNNVLSTQLASGEGPDIILDGGSFPARVKANNLLDISDEDIVEGFNDNAFALSKDQDDHIYGIPSYGWFSGIWINEELFDENEIEIPTSFDEFVNVSEQLKENDVRPISLGLLDGDVGLHSLVGYLENSYYRDDADAVDNDIKFSYGETTLSEHLGDSVNEWEVLIEKGILNKEMLGVSSEQSLNEFINQDAAMFYGGPWNYSQFKDAGLKFKMIPHLGMSGEEYLIGGPAANMGVNANTKNEEGALEVLRVLASDEAQHAFLESNPGSFSFKKDITEEIPSEYELVANSLAEGKVACAWDRWGVNMPTDTFVGEIKKQIQNLVSEDISTDEFLNNLDKKANEIRYK